MNHDSISESACNNVNNNQIHDATCYIKFNSYEVKLSREEFLKFTLQDVIDEFILKFTDDHDPGCNHSSECMHQSFINREQCADHPSDHSKHQEETLEALLLSSSFYFAHQAYKPLRLNVPIVHYFNSALSHELHHLELRSHYLDGIFGLVGGKGGFGSLLRQSKSKKKTTNFSAMRDLSGRRFRHITNQINLKQWNELVEKRKQQIKEKRAKEREAKRERAREQITLQREIIREKEEQVVDAVKVGLEKAFNNGKNGLHVAAASNSSPSSSSSSNDNTKTTASIKRKSKFDHHLSDEE
ncbi:hypothetical protein FDP41_001538 [Naegleria fowleri]|uniref:SDE2-like domain-containing protein n=1 Tax=Naegleria fowleri TaxID=5763 RepID=A0A6A5C0Y8_NAEFO|nr:uncharacterized protein FDP41_001538 [Naegleria fowleri]KAF0979195.1 hypothetical protein FDP41_001538 [Naegleria fowleri]CAG4717199.1 unnamed protein product [Naegleria fowleri]